MSVLLSADKTNMLLPSVRRSVFMIYDHRCGGKGAGGRLPRALQLLQVAQRIVLSSSDRVHAVAAYLDSKEENARKSEEPESVLTLS